LRESSPSWPINNYWGGLYWSILLLCVMDFLVSFVPLICLWRSYYVFRPRGHAPEQYKIGCLRVPKAVATLLFADRTLLPGKRAVLVIRCLLPILCVALLMCLAVLGMAISVSMGMWGSGATGRSCTSAAGADIENCETMRTSCDPLDPSECLLPFPSSFLLVNDSATVTGKRVHIKPETMVPLNGGGPGLLDPAAWNSKDGFRYASLLPACRFVSRSTLVVVFCWASDWAGAFITKASG
jgi:hypothetical protein